MRIEAQLFDARDRNARLFTQNDTCVMRKIPFSHRSLAGRRYISADGSRRKRGQFFDDAAQGESDRFAAGNAEGKSSRWFTQFALQF